MTKHGTMKWEPKVTRYGVTTKGAKTSVWNACLKHVRLLGFRGKSRKGSVAYEAAKRLYHGELQDAIEEVD